MTRSTIIALVAAALLAATMPVYALVAQARPGDPDVARRPRTALLGRWVRDWFMWVIAPLERLFIAPYYVNYHLEHHLLMTVPHYHLPRLHRLLRERGVLEGACITRGYPAVLRLAASRPAA